MKSTSPIRVVVAGSSGRMGRVMMRDLGADGDITVLAKAARAVMRTDRTGLIRGAEMLFGLPEA